MVENRAEVSSFDCVELFSHVINQAVCIKLEEEETENLGQGRRHKHISAAFRMSKFLRVFSAWMNI